MNNIKLIALSGVLIPVISPSHAQKKEKPSFLIILVDDFGWTDLGCYGSSFYETPNIDRLASEGIRFTNGYAACPVSSPMRSGMQTGMYPNRTGITDWLPGRAASQQSSETDRWLAAKLPEEMAPGMITFAEVLKNNGYKTFFAGKWHLGKNPELWPEQQGYDINIGGCSLGSPRKDDKSNGYFAPYGNPRLEDGPVGEYLPERLTTETVNFLETNKDKPFLAFLSFYLVHTPLQAKKELIEKYEAKRNRMGLTPEKEMFLKPAWAEYATRSSSYKERIVQGNPVYAAMVQALDDNVGRLIEKIKELGLDKNTVILFTSDNGGLSTAEGSPTSNLPLKAGKGWLYEGGIRVPYILWSPGLQKGSVNDMPISTVDVFPTILSFAGVKPPASLVLDGIDLTPYLEKKMPHPDRALFWDYPHYSNQGGNPGSAIRKGKYKLIDDYETGKTELYDLEVDSAEQHNLSDQLPGKRDELFRELQTWRKETGSKTMLPNPGWNKKEPHL